MFKIKKITPITYNVCNLYIYYISEVSISEQSMKQSDELLELKKSLKVRIRRFWDYCQIV